MGIQKELKAFAASGKKTKVLTHGKTPCLRLEMTIGASGVNARWTYKKQKTNTADGFNLGLGAYPGVTLKEARCKAEAIAEQIAAGLNPKEERERQAQAEVEAKALGESELRWRTPFRTVADEWIEVKEKEGLWAHDARGADKARSYLRNWILPVLGDMAINDVDRSACIRLVRYRDMGTRQDTDAKCRRLVNQICIYAHEKGYRQSDEAPANKNDPVFKEECKPLMRRRKEKGHNSALPPEDMPEFMAQLKRMPGIGARALEFMILTVGRQDSICHEFTKNGQVLGLRWEHLDLVRGIWHQPPEGTKMKRSEGVDLMLSSYAMQLLRTLPRSADVPFVFADLRRPKPHSISNMTMARTIKDMNKVRERAGLPLWLDPQKSKKAGEPRPVTPHGMRTCFKTWTMLTAHGNYARFNPNVVERCLDHAVKDQFGGAYYRQGLSADDETHEREIMEAWGRYCIEGKWPDED
ncbi:tyrosine-type recombinase/integrase [Sutterella wadsworthensis]|uniref:tyrosine-type recombinase/integrase n=1 Tax=Sutterella wadsworthensis TaxID=40545 RepID=UPI0013F69BDD|nr:integrase arm-type DNA-binding domain-containing protein [Sutterella wadsworthensis]